MNELTVGVSEHDISFWFEHNTVAYICFDRDPFEYPRYYNIRISVTSSGPSGSTSGLESVFEMSKNLELAFHKVKLLLSERGFEGAMELEFPEEV